MNYLKYIFDPLQYYCLQLAYKKAKEHEKSWFIIAFYRYLQFIFICYQIQIDIIEIKNLKEPQKMQTILYFIYLIIIANASSSMQLMNRCLGNCSVCQSDQPEICSVRQSNPCMHGYTGPGCMAKFTLANSITLVHTQSKDLSSILWSDNSKAECTYMNSLKQKKSISVLGLYTKIMQNKITLEIRPNYQNFILHFNLIRNGWTPYQDYIYMSIKTEAGQSLKQQTMEVQQRDQINSITNPLRCRNNQPTLIQKYEIKGTLEPQKYKKIIIQFGGQLGVQSFWGLTNTKIAFGCSSFLLFDDNDCSKCMDGFYKVVQNKQVTRCQVCPLNCALCSQMSVCQKCVAEYSLSNGKCVNKLNFTSLSVSNRSLNCSNKMYLQSSTVGVNQKLETSFSQLPAHKRVRLIFYLAYVPQLFSNTNRVFINVDNKQVSNINGSTLKGNQSFPKQVCVGFGQKDYFSIYKVITPYFEHGGDNLSLSLTADGNRKMGISQIGLQYEPVVQPPKNVTQNNTNGSSSNNGSNSSTLLPNTLPNSTNNTSNSSASSNMSNANATNNSSNSNATNNSNANINTTNNSNTNFSNNSSDLDQNKSSGNDSANSNNSQNNQTNNSTDVANQTNKTQPKTNNIQFNADLTPIVHQLQKVKKDFRVGVKQDRNLIVTLQYPILLKKVPFISGHFINSSRMLIPSSIYTSQNGFYQELTFDLEQSLLMQSLQIIISNQNPVKVAKRTLQEQILQKKQFRINPIVISRFDKLTPGQWESTKKYGTFYEVIAWVTIISTIIFQFFGSSIITQKFSMLLQIIFLHVYINTQYLPMNFMYTIAGLQRMQNLDYFQAHISTGIQKLLLGNVIQLSPTKFTIFNKDVNFTRMIYPCIIMCFLYLIWHVLINIVRKLIEPGLVVSDAQQQRSHGQRMKLFIIRIAERFLNYWHQVWQYMYITFIWAVLLQFNNMKYPVNSDKSDVANMIFCFLFFIIALSLPVLTFLYLNKKYFRLDYFEYSYWYENIFFLKLPEQSLPSNHHRISIIIRNVRYILLAICFAYLGSYPIQALILIIFTHLFSLIYMILAHIQIKPFNNKLNIIQHTLLIILAILMLVAYGISGTASTSQYLTIGHILTTCCMLLTVLGLVRVFYYIYCKFNHGIMEKQLSQFKPAIGTERVV